MSTRALFKK